MRFTVSWRLKSGAAPWKGMSHELRVTPPWAVPPPMGHSPTGSENGLQSKDANSIDSPWQNKWCTRTRCSIRSKRRLGQRQVWGQGYSVHPKDPSRRHSLRQVHLHHTSCSDWSPSPELKWRSWTHGQRVSVRVPGEPAQGHYGLTQSQGKKKINVIKCFRLFTKKNVEITWVHNCNGLRAKMHLSYYTQLEKTSPHLNFF